MVAHCDFCGRPFSANPYNQRTCVACECKGAPDQSKPRYDKLIQIYHRANATIDSGGQGRPVRGKTGATLSLRSNRGRKAVRIEQARSRG
jgi:hypothetical protein